MIGPAMLRPLLVLLLSLSIGRAEVVRVEIQERKPFAEGRSFGLSGAYESIAGRLHFEIDPRDPANARVADLSLAPLNADGRVAFWADFFLLKPVHPEKGSGCLLYDVHNRGNKLALWTFNEGVRSNLPETAEHAGNGFLMREGHTLLWTGWSGEIRPDDTHRLLGWLPTAAGKNGEPITGRAHVEITVDEPAESREFFWSPWGTADAYPAASLDQEDAILTRRAHRGAPAEVVPREAWQFARREEGAVVPDATSVYLAGGFQPGWIYDLVYTARNPRISGLGLVGLRDAVSFFRHESGATQEARNPLRGTLNRALIFGVSQSGRLIHHFLHEGFNLDPAGRRVFDGALIHVAGAGKGLFNSRFGMATVYGTHRLGNLSGADFFPFAPVPQTDPVTGETGDSLARLRNGAGLPKVFFVQTSTEYWSRGASLLHTDVEGKRDLEPDPNTRLYLIAGTQHLGGSDDPGAKGVCRHPLNPVKHRGPVLRALLTALDRWVIDDNAAPPASRHPRLDDGSLVPVEAFQSQFPDIPGVAAPDHVYQPRRLDHGPRWESEGIADEVPPLVGDPYVTLVPAVDADGNEIAGIRLPDIAVPLGTATGWNLRADAHGAGGLLADLNGGWFPFAREQKARADTGDPRPSLAERYPSREVYLGKISQTLVDLVEAGYLLEEDVARYLARAVETSAEIP